MGQPGGLLPSVLTMAHRGSPHHGTRQKDPGCPGHREVHRQGPAG